MDQLAQGGDRLDFCGPTPWGDRRGGYNLSTFSVLKSRVSGDLGRSQSLPQIVSIDRGSKEYFTEDHDAIYT